MVFPKTAHTPITIATAGEALIDLIETPSGALQPCAGGAVYNLSRALALQGTSTAYLNPLSHDRFGRLLAHGLAQAHVQCAQPEAHAAPTSLAVVSLDPAGKARYSFYRDGVADRQISAESLIELCQAWPLRMVACGCLALMPQDQSKYLPWLQTQRQEGRLVAIDANLRPALVADMAPYQASVMAALQQAHIIKVSDDDLQVLGLSSTDPIAGARQLLAQTPAIWLALTLGAQGAVLMHRSGQTWHGISGRPIHVVDTVGAGDCFFAGLLTAGLEVWPVASTHLDAALALSPQDIEHVLGRAIVSASFCVEQTGCVPPTRDQVLSRLAQDQLQIKQRPSA